MSKDLGIRIRYEQHGVHPHSARVYLNDIDISHGLRGFKVEAEDGCLTHVELHVAPDQLDIDAKTLAVLSAVVESNLK